MAPWLPSIGGLSKGRRPKDLSGINHLVDAALDRLIQDFEIPAAPSARSVAEEAFSFFDRRPCPPERMYCDRHF
jgi:hypothetical protein